MSLWEMGIFISSIFFVLELRRIRKKFEELNGILSRAEWNFIIQEVKKKK